LQGGVAFFKLKKKEIPVLEAVSQKRENSQRGRLQKKKARHGGVPPKKTHKHQGKRKNTAGGGKTSRGKFRRAGSEEGVLSEWQRERGGIMTEEGESDPHQKKGRHAAGPSEGFHAEAQRGGEAALWLAKIGESLRKERG